MPDKFSTIGQSEGQVQQTIRDLVSEANGLVILARAYGRGLEPTGIISAQQQVLRVLATNPRTVPELARERSSSRQNIQIVVNRLAEMRLVEAIDNPKHRRSKLIRLLPAGRAAIEKINHNLISAAMPFDHSKLEPEALGAAVKTLRVVRQVWLGSPPTPLPGRNDDGLSVVQPIVDPQPPQPVQLEPQPPEELPVNLL